MGSAPALRHLAAHLVAAWRCGNRHHGGRSLPPDRYFIAGTGLGLDGRKRMLAPGASTGGRGPMHVSRKDTISYGSGLYHWRDEQGRHIHFHGGDGDFGFNALILWREEDDVFIAGLFNSGSPADSFSREEFTSKVLAAAEHSRK